MSCGGITGPVYLTLRYFFHRSLAYLRLGTQKYMYPHCSARTNFSLCRTRYFSFFSTYILTSKTSLKIFNLKKYVNKLWTIEIDRQGDPPGLKVYPGQNQPLTNDSQCLLVCFHSRSFTITNLHTSLRPLSSARQGPV